MDPAQLFIPINTPVLQPNGKIDPTWWKFFVDFAGGISTIDLATQVTGVLPSENGGTGIDNGNRHLVIGGFDLGLIQTAPSLVTMPTSGTLISTTALKSKRVTTGSVGAGGTALIVVTWDTSFTDANYTAVVSVEDTTAAAASMTIVHIEAKAAASISVRVNNASGGAIVGTINAIAFHD